jgi:hypothetical protein
MSRTARRRACSAQREAVLTTSPGTAFASGEFCASRVISATARAGPRRSAVSIGFAPRSTSGAIARGRIIRAGSRKEDYDVRRRPDWICRSWCRTRNSELHYNLPLTRQMESCFASARNWRTFDLRTSLSMCLPKASLPSERGRRIEATIIVAKVLSAHQADRGAKFRRSFAVKERCGRCSMMPPSGCDLTVSRC